MQSIHILTILDIAASVIITVLATLSKRLGAALKISPYYRLLYGSVVLIITASFLNAVSLELSAALGINLSGAFPNALRFIAGAIAVGVCLRYWKWLFTEFLKK
jgi:hypothetical protein